jgi:hypothetical protein
MSESNNLKNFNIESILNEISGVIHTGLNNILDEFMEKYNDYEANYNAVLNLPAVKNKINSLSINSNSNNSVNSNLNNNIMSSMYKTFNSQMKELQKENEELKAEIYVLKSRLPPVIDLTSETETDIKKPIIIKQEPENITLVIEEQPNEEVASLEDAESDVSLEDAESDASLDEEESVASLEEESESVASLEEEEADANEVEEEESVANEVEEEEADANKVEEEESVAKEVEEKEEESDEEEEEDDASLEEDDAKSVETETKEEDVASLEEEEEVEEEELFEIEIDDKTYCTNNEESGFIYELDSDGNVGDKIGYFKESEPIFYSEE